MMALGGCAPPEDPPQAEEIATRTSAVEIQPLFTELTLQNGWLPDPRRSPGVAIDSTLVRLKGGIKTSGTNPVAFTLPPAFRPDTNVYVPVTLCGAANGRLNIAPDGSVRVQAETSFANAQCGTSLDGVSFAPSSFGFTPLTLQNGWTNYAGGTSAPAARMISGVVHFKGAMATAGTNPVAFTLPALFRPATTAYIPIDLCSAAKGRLVVQPSGAVEVRVAPGVAFSSAQCFTSLEGAFFVKDPAEFSAAELLGGWSQSTAFGAGPVGYRQLGGAVYLKGAIAGGTDAIALHVVAFSRVTVRVPVDLCDGRRGAVTVDHRGQIAIEAEGGAFYAAQCQTSLEGVSFVPTEFVPITPEAGWTITDSQPAVAVIGGNVFLEGAMFNTQPAPGVALVLPAEVRPAVNVYVPAVLCGGKFQGRLVIQPSGSVFVEAQAGVVLDNSCPVSFSAWYALSTSSFTTLTLQDGWTGAPFGTRNPALTKADGFVQMAGAMRGGTSATPFTLPAGFRPPADVYLPVDLCNAKKGRLLMQPSGAVTVFDERGGSADASCFTSLEGVSFATSEAVLLDLPLLAGWQGGPFSTHAAQYSPGLGGIVRLVGAVASGTNIGLFTAPEAIKPAKRPRLPVDLCGGMEGGIRVEWSGTSVVVAADWLQSAQCFTSLEGVTYPM